MIIRIFPNSKEEFEKEYQLKKWLKSELIKNGKYHLRTLNGVGLIPSGSMVLFRFDKNIVGHALVEETVKPIDRKLNGVIYHGLIKFNKHTIRVYKKSYPVKLLGKYIERNLTIAQPYYKLDAYKLLDKLMLKIVSLA